jgi:hypothetical protein
MEEAHGRHGQGLRPQEPRHVVSVARSGAGGIRLSSRILRIVDAPGALQARGADVLQADYQYKTDRARRTLRGIDEQMAKAEKAVAGKAPVKRNRFIKLVGADKRVSC